MKVQQEKCQIALTILSHVQLDMREAAFLREMAKHCVATRMPGNVACERLDSILDRMGVPEHDRMPVYGLFEVEK